MLLDEVDKVLQARGYSFARYADDRNVYVGSVKAGERVMVLLRKLYAGLKLQINEAKSAVGSAFGRKFLGYALWVSKGQDVKCAVARKALDNFKARIRHFTGRMDGRSMEQVVEKLRPYLLGWKAYFGMWRKHPVSGASWARGCVIASGRFSSSTGEDPARPIGNSRHWERRKTWRDKWR